MAKDNYREKVEEHRQQIDLHNESEAKMSRVSRHRKKGAKKNRNPLMTLLVFVFIFIPLGILGYVLFIFDPGADTATTGSKEAEKDQLVEILKQDPKEVKVVESDENDNEKEDVDAEATAKEQAVKEKLAAEEAKKAEQQKAAEEKKVKEVEEAQKVAIEKAKEQEQKKKEETKNTEQQTHTVQSTDNLYRIAIKYYGDGSEANIEKIKKANNLTSDSISTGQVLIINP